MADDQPDQNIETKEEVEIEDSACETFTDGQLCYVGFDVETIPQKLIDEYSKVTRRLDLSFNQIRQVTGLEEFCNLEELVLDNNILDDSTVFPCLNHLHTLTINKNKLSDLNALLDNLESKFPNLRYLSLLGNQACPNQLSCHDKDDEDYIRYRYQVLYRLPALKFLDSSQVRKSDLEEAKRVGPYMTVVRGQIPNEKSTKEAKNTRSRQRGSRWDPRYFFRHFDDVSMADWVMVPDEISPQASPQYSPLPVSMRTADDHQGTFGKSKYVYYGKHSEGNRFIRNNDL